jgi:hypothetical protein
MYDIIALIVLSALIFFLTFGIGFLERLHYLTTATAVIHPHHNIINKRTDLVPEITKTPVKNNTEIVDKKSPLTRISPLVEQRRRDSQRSFTDILNKATSEDKELGEVMKNLFPKGFGTPSSKDTQDSFVFETPETTVQ